MRVTELTDDDRIWVKERTELLFGGDFVVSRQEVHDPHQLPGFIATEGNERVGLATFSIIGGECELVTIDSLCQFMGVGTALLPLPHALLVAHANLFELFRPPFLSDESGTRPQRCRSCLSSGAL